MLANCNEKGQNYFAPLYFLEMRQVITMVFEIPQKVEIIINTLEKAGYECKQTEGYRTANWILLDFGDIVIHIFNHEDRLFYDLERIWSDGKIVEPENL